MGWQTDLSSVEEVQSFARAPEADDLINDHLKKGWILLDVRATEVRDEKKTTPSVTWVLGRRRERRRR
jgi:hypothetical protein